MRPLIIDGLFLFPASGWVEFNNKRRNMDSVASLIFVGFVVFVFTNIDDLFVVSAFFADPRLARSSVIIGQFVGIGALVLLSTLAALFSVAIPASWIALLGVVPLFLGLYKLKDLQLFSTQEFHDAGEKKLQNQAPIAEGRQPSQILAIATVTIANGGDNLGAYIPLFAKTPQGILIYALVFALMTTIWCRLAFLIVNHRRWRYPIHRYGHVALPFVLIALGFYILSDAAVLFR